MISLSILNDFCSWWFLWWLAPFILGLALGAALWGKYKARVRDLEESQVRYKSSISDLESKISKVKGERDTCRNDLNRFEKQMKSSKDEISNLKRKVLQQKVSKDLSEQSGTASPDNFPNPKKAALTGAAIGAGSAAASGSMSDSPKSKNPYSKLSNSNLQIIEGIGPKLESILKDNGISNWKTLSSKSKGELKAILEGQGPRYNIIDPSSWPLQAHKAYKGNWDALIELQSDDGSESKLLKIMSKLGLK